MRFIYGLGAFFGGGLILKRFFAFILCPQVSSSLLVNNSLTANLNTT
jgi:hypothetical protein